MIQPGAYIKLLTDVKTTSGIVLPQYSIVTVLSNDESNNKMQVRDVLDEIHIIPSKTRVKVIGRSKDHLKASSEATSFISAAPRTERGIDSKIQRAIMGAQVITSQANLLDDPVLLNKLAIACNLYNMSLGPTMNSGQSMRLQALAKKLTV